MKKSIDKNIPDPDTIGETAYSMITEMFPICRSITGDGLRQTLGILGKRLPIQTREVPTGTRVFDWSVPKEWNIKDAYVKDSSGKRVIDFCKSNLHVVNYSVPVHETLPLSELKKNLFSLPDRPDWVPYKTTYYKESWGFCLSHNQLVELENGEYEVCIDSSLKEGHLTYGELYIPGRQDDEILISCHACHPSLANDNLSGVSLATLLAERIGTIEHRYSYRFLFIPGTIGAITWLALNKEKSGKIKHGLVLSGLGDKGNISYKKSRRGNTTIDRAATHVLHHSGQNFTIMDFSPYGYDERQYCSPGFDLPVGRLSRTPFGTYPEYHTSADNLDFVTASSLGQSFRTLWEIVQLLEDDSRFVNKNPHCEPQLGKRGLYNSIGDNELAMLWVLNLSDGNNSLLDIADRSGLNFGSIRNAAGMLHDYGLLEHKPGD